MLSNYLIGLREGLEAALIVGILVAYVVNTGHRDKLRLVWYGVAAAVGLSLALGAVLSFTSATMGFQAQEAFGGVVSLVAVGCVTWMVFWMKTSAVGIRNELHGRLDSALAATGFTLALLAFVAVAREGLETALFLFAAVQATGQTVTPLVGAACGLATAVLVGWLVYRGAVKLNLTTFFTWTGAALVVVAAGVFAYGVHDLQEAEILPGLNVVAWDVSEQFPPSSWYVSVVRGTLNITPEETWLQVVAWLAYLIPVMVLYLRPSHTSSHKEPTQEG